METRSRFSLLVLAASLMAAPAANAVMYRWVEDDGSVKYSDKPPEDRSAVRELTTIVPPKTAAPEPARQPVQQQPAVAAPEPAVIKAEQPIARPAAGAAPGVAAPRVTTEAVQDPCLRSADPKCYERNKDRYHPYLGYAPGVGGPAPRAVGATSSAGAGGAVSGSIPPAIGSAQLEPRKGEPSKAPTPNR